MSLERAFFSGEKPCSNGCGYCFSRWSTPPRFDIMPCLSYDDWKVVYPVCDSEAMRQDAHFWRRVREFLKNHPKCVASISTKDEWSDDELDRVDAIRDEAGENSIKISISMSCKTLLGEIEPYASRYAERVGLLGRLAARRICHSLMLKPLLPFVSLDEYVEIVEDVRSVCSDFVTGNLYVDQSTGFFRKYIAGRYHVERRYCEWMKREVDFVPYQKEQELVRYIRSQRLNWHSSDIEFLMTQNKERWEA